MTNENRNPDIVSMQCGHLWMRDAGEDGITIMHALDDSKLICADDTELRQLWRLVNSWLVRKGGVE